MEKQANSATEAETQRRERKRDGQRKECTMSRVTVIEPTATH